MTRAIEVQQMLSAAFAAGDRDAMRALFDERCVIREAPGLPFGGTWVGADGFEAMIGQLFDRFEMTSEPVEVFEVNDSVVITLTNMTFTSRRDGLVNQMPVLEILRTEGGRLIEAMPFYWDGHALHDG